MDFTAWAAAIGDSHWLRQLVIMGGAVVLALIVRLIFARVISVFTRKTATDIDNRIASELRRPFVTTIILVGVILAYLEFQAPVRS